jgi:ligand-binding sensor domain-containing protein
MNCRPAICILLFFFELSSTNYLQAQDNYQLKTFTSDNGLSHNFVQSIAQDQTGFLWIATWDGLSRYDGYEFKNYYHKPNDSTSFPFFSTDKVLADRLNNIWIFTQGLPVSIYDRAKDCFHPLNSAAIKNTSLSDIIIGPDKNIWMAVSGAICQYNPETKQLTSYKMTGDTYYKLIFDKYGPQLAFDNKDGIWIYYLVSNEYHIFKGTFLKDSTIRFHQFGWIPIYQYKSSVFHNGPGNFDIYISGSGKTWLFSRYGLFYFDNAQERFVDNKSPVDPGEFKGKPYFVWTDDKSGIHIIDTKNEWLVNLTSKNENFIETVFIDKSGIIWSGDVNPSHENIGLNRYLKIPDYFEHFLTGKNENNSINLVFPILKDENNDLWIGTRYLDYLIRIKPDRTQEKINFTGGFNSQNNTEVKSLVQDSGGIWIGTASGKLFYYDYITKKTRIRFSNQNSNADSSLSVHNILKTSNSLIINGDKGIFRLIPETNSLNLYYRHLPSGTGFSLVHDGKNGFWLGTFSNTVIHLNSELNKTEEFKLGPENNIVEHVCIGDSNDIWTALMGGGLGHLYLTSGKTEIFTTADGLSNNVTYSILKDRKGNLWISTNNGLSRFNPHTSHFRNFGKAEGLRISEFNSDSYFQAPDGEMFFGGIGGIVGFYPDSIDNYQNKIILAPLIITDFKVSGVPRYFKKAIYEMDTITLEKGDNNFQVTYACLDFQNPEKIRYRYRLVGENNEWAETDYRNRKINYAHLTHRDYKLEIEATSESDEWVNKTSILIRIPHHLTEIFWLRLSVIILVLLGIFFTGIVYVRQLRLKNKRIQDQLKLECLRGQMNPHFIFNSLNSINYFISQEDKLSANNYIADFSRLMRSILHNLSSEYIPFEKEIESLQDYLKLEHLRFGDKFNYLINADKILNSNEISVFPGMVQPFVENAIWHGVRGLEQRTGIIRIEFIPVSPAKIQCVIEDDGIGRKLAHLYRNEIPGHKSRGIVIVNERLRIINSMTKYNYQVTIEDLYPGKEESGTRVTLDLPARVTDSLKKD